jgi:spermidine synthase
MEKFQYGQQVIFQTEEILQDFQTQKTHVQYIRTKYHGDILFMDGEVQFSTLDEKRYHKLLVPNLEYGRKKRNILILGGGDGLALRNVYEFPGIQRAVVVDYDQEFIEKFALDYPLNNGSLKDPRTVIVYMDAFEFLNKCSEKFDTVIVDLPDPDSFEMQELYFKIFRSLPNVIHEGYSNIVSHVGPISLCDNHPNWTFIKKLKSDISIVFGDNAIVSLYSDYIPSYSHEWGVIRIDV